MLAIYEKRPADTTDYDIDFAKWMADGDQVSGATAQVTPWDSMVSVLRIDKRADGVRVWLVDGVAGKTATIGVTITTTQGRIKQVEFKIRVGT